jgi:hypothetical protein
VLIGCPDASVATTVILLLTDACLQGFCTIRPYQIYPESLVKPESVIRGAQD